MRVIERSARGGLIEEGGREGWRSGEIGGDGGA